jgi:NAD(P)-dependent dehydrogenase (short-subunit alcohol dehydrogenase family)
MTGRRRSYLAHWAPLHNMTVEEATAKFPQEAGIARYGEPEEIAELMAFLVSPGARWMTGSTLRMDWRRGQIGLRLAPSFLLNRRGYRKRKGRPDASALT